MTFNNIVPFEDIKLVSKRTTEKIAKKYLKEFLKTNLNLENIHLSEDCKVYITYINNYYEILVVKNQNKTIVLEPQLFELYYQLFGIKSSNIDIFVTKKYFSVYKNGKLFFVKANNNYTNNDIINFVGVTYKLDVDNLYEISDEILEKLTQIKQKITPLKYFKLNSSKGFYIYTGYIVSVFLAGFFLLFTTNTKSNNQIQELIDIKTKFNKAKNKNSSNKVIIANSLIEISNELHSYNLLLLQFKYDKKFNFKIETKNKKNFYDFVSNYGKKIVIKNITKIDKKFHIEFYCEC